MIDEHEYALIKHLIRKVVSNIDNFTTIDSDVLVMNVNGSMSMHHIGIRDKTTGTKIYERDLVNFNNYKILNKALSYLYNEIAEKDVRDELRKMDKAQELCRNSLIDYLNKGEHN